MKKNKHRHTWKRILVVSLCTGMLILVLHCGWAADDGEVNMFQLSNGLKVIYKNNPSNNILAVECFIDVNAAHEDPSKRGVRNLIQRLLLKGTKKRSAFEIAAGMESIGGDIETSAKMDYALVSAISTVDDIDVTFDYLSDVIFNPVFPKYEFEKERANVLAGIRRAEDDKFSFTYKHFLESMYPGHPYEFRAEGTEETVSSITRKDIQEFYKTHYAPEVMTLAIVGNVEEELLQQKVRKWFGQYRRKAHIRIETSKSVRAKRRTKTISKDVEQGFIIAGYLTVPVNDAHYPAIKVASAILGRGMSSRLFTRVRDEKGLAYSLGSAFPSSRLQSHVFSYIGTHPEMLDASLQAVLREYELLAEKPVTKKELERAKNYLIGSFLIDHQTNAQQAWYLGWYETIGLGYEFDQKFPDIIKEVTVKDVAKVCRGYFRHPVIVILEPTQEAASQKNTQNE